MIITEKVEIPLKSLKNIALVNVKSVAPDVSVVMEEYRNVNGLKVLCLQPTVQRRELSLLITAIITLTKMELFSSLLTRLKV